ncbi:MAG TPA: bifunctional DNA-binding transcriptional regulator/O6-methylguanine-DNA methyltransferase Ada [Terriglobales bacterium]|nr:bifunctional DNA-binding transcriptional regulator/O6-methylguanine-DNA methyltransferase Ada [Terriglobales bacterium]
MEAMTRAWAALEARDRAADGQFVYSVRTTGVYCRPSCGARRALPENVAFHATCAEAERAGFRPCLRCHPERAREDAASVAAACRALESTERRPKLSQLARAAGLSPFHFHRLFKATTGVTPGQYAAGRRGERVRAALAGSRSVTDALYDAGYQSSGRFYAAAQATLGMAPARYRAGGAQLAIEFAIAECSLGRALVAATPRGLCAVMLGDDPRALVADLKRRFPRAAVRPAPPAFGRKVAQVVRLIATPGRGMELPLDIQGSAFQVRVWQALRQIPAGETRSYSELARTIGAPGAVRAVASACGANPLAVVIPCHRARRASGELAGYRWGIERKKELLRRESGARGPKK